MNALLSLNQNLDGMKRQLDEIEECHSNSSLGLALVDTEERVRLQLHQAFPAS